MRRLQCRGRAVLLGLRRSAGLGPRDAHAQDGHDPLQRSGRLHRPRRAPRPGVAARGHGPLLHRDAGRHRPPRRARGEVHRRRDHGRLRRSSPARGRRASRRAVCPGDARGAHGPQPRAGVRLGGDAARALWALDRRGGVRARRRASVLRPRRRRQRRPAARVRGTRRRGAHQPPDGAAAGRHRPPAAARSADPQGQVRARPRLASGGAAAGRRGGRQRAAGAHGGTRPRSWTPCARRWPTCRPSGAAVWSPSSDPRASASRAWCAASSPTPRRRPPPPSVAASPTARASPSGRWPRSSSSSPDAPTSPRSPPSSATTRRHDGPPRGLRSRSGSHPAPRRSRRSSWRCAALLEAAARRRPLVVVVEDIHWAEPTLLDVLEHVASHAHDVAAAPGLPGASRAADRPPSSPAADTVRLAPLSERESEHLLEQLDPTVARDADERARLLAAAEGNPFFLEQMVAMRQETGSPASTPATIQAVLAARIDALTHMERAVIDCAAIEGRQFHRGVVAELLAAPDRRFARAGARLARPARPHPPRTPGPARRGGVPLLAHPDPRGGLHAPPQGPARRPARALRPPARGTGRRRPRPRRDHRLPLRAGLPVLDRSAAGAGVRPSPSGPRRRPPSGRRRPRCARTRRRAGGRQPPPARRQAVR